MKTFTSGALMALCLWLAGCTSLNQSIASQNAVVAQLHEHFNAGNYEAIWLGAHARLQGEIEKEKFVQYLQEIRGKLGKALSSANTERRMTTANQRTLVYMVQKTAFENGRAIETLTVQMDGERAILVAYNVQSKLLDVR